MSATILAVAALALLGATGLAVASTLRLGSLAEVAVAAFVVAFGEVVIVVLVLSQWSGVRRVELLVATCAIAAVSVATWARAGRPLPTAPTVGRLSAPVVALGLAIAAALGYALALALGTPPNSVDSLVYHLARAAFWRQAGGAGYIGDAYDGRLDANPPNAELALTFVLEVTRDERLASVVQFLAALVCSLSIFAIGRRLGLARGEAAFGALLFLALPVVLLQSATTLNDLVVAAPLLAATLFLLREGRACLVIVALATALAIGTKVNAVFGLPVLCATALVASPAGARLGRLVALGVGALAGSYWYVVNLVETHELLGRRPDTELLAVGDLRENVQAGLARVLDTLELPGAEGTTKFVLPDLGRSDALVYVLVAIALAVVLTVGGRLTGRPTARQGLAAGALATLPLAIPPLSYLVWRLFAKVHDALGGTAPRLPIGEWPPQTVASETFSWFGPIGLAFVVGTSVLATARFRRDRAALVPLVLGLAPVASLCAFSLSLGYDVFQGRFFVFPVALSAALWGATLRVRPVAWAAVAVAVAGVALALVHSLEKPSGVELVADRHARSIWGMPRWSVQSLLRAEMTDVLRYLDERVPDDAGVALAMGEDDLGYPAFGRHLRRTIRLVPSHSDGRGIDAGWLVANPIRAASVARACWRPALTTREGWIVFVRAQRC